MTLFEAAQLRQVARPQPRRDKNKGLTAKTHLAALDDDLDDVWRGLLSLHQTQQNTNRFLAAILITLIFILLGVIVDMLARFTDVIGSNGSDIVPTPLGIFGLF